MTKEEASIFNKLKENMCLNSVTLSEHECYVLVEYIESITRCIKKLEDGNKLEKLKQELSHYLFFDEDTITNIELENIINRIEGD